MDALPLAIASHPLCLPLRCRQFHNKLFYSILLTFSVIGLGDLLRTFPFFIFTHNLLEQPTPPRLQLIVLATY